MYLTNKKKNGVNKMTVEQIKLELEDAEKFLKQIETEVEKEDICAIYAMELDREINMLYDYIESLENDLHNQMKN